MRKTLYLKMLIAYLIFAVFSFIIVSTFMQQMTIRQLEQDKARELYKNASLLAQNEALAVYKNEMSLISLKDIIDRNAAISDAVVRIVNPSGLIIVSSDYELNVDNPEVIENFDATSLSGSFYSVGTFYDSLDGTYLTVASPITSGPLVHGYVVASYDVEMLEDASNHLLNLDYILLLITFLLSLIILIYRAGIHTPAKDNNRYRAVRFRQPSL